MNDKPWYKSKKIWALILGTVLGVAKPIAADHGIEIPIEAFAPLTAYLIGQGIADHGKK